MVGNRVPTDCTREPGTRLLFVRRARIRQRGQKKKKTKKRWETVGRQVLGPDEPT